ncbi:MAG: ribosomal RNA small subunit methyltransferase A [Promethearchaeota archaeon]|nr:MAG: ribosomal RNA small subunit methyltransferase A [Candidatus Lokiarchaeota archaeon]
MYSHEGRIIEVTRSQLISRTNNLLKKYGLRAFKSYSQHFVVEPKLIHWHLKYANLTKEDVVVEVGAGLGTLTQFLAQRVKRVIAVEFDPEFIAILHEELADCNNVEIMEGDILKLGSNIFNGRKIVSNPPYKISSPLTFEILQSEFILAVMSYQKEFAERLIAQPGMKNYSRVTLGVQYYAKVESLRMIPRNYFRPPPKVDSTLVRLTPIVPPIHLENEREFFDFVRHLFSFRKKSVRRALGLYLKQQEGQEQIKSKLETISLASKRVFQLSLPQFYELFEFLKDQKTHDS